MFILSLAQLYHEDYIPKTSHYYAVYLAVFLSGYSVNVFFVRLLPLITNISVGVINFGTFSSLLHCWLNLLNNLQNLFSNT